MPDPAIITRPAAQAGPFAQRVAALGRAAVIFPLLEIHPLEDQSSLIAALDELPRYAMAIFVSPNAIDAVFSILERWPEGVAIGVMGEGSRVRLADHGITPACATIISPLDADRTDSQTLLAALDIDGLRGRQVLIIRGDTGRQWLAEALQVAGVEVRQLAAYRRIAPAVTPERIVQLNALLDQRNDWVMTSSEALRNLADMVKETAGDAGVAKMQRQSLIVPHARIAETARTLGFTDVILTGSGDERMLAALQFRP